MGAQVVSAAGRVGRIGAADTTPVARARVLLHEVAVAKQAPVDSAFTDPRGRFTFRFRPDSGAIYLVSARHDGIEYFSSPISSLPNRPDTALLVTVADTSSLPAARAAVEIAARHIVVMRPGPEGVRDVLDLMTLRNDGRYTLVAPDTLEPSWTMLVPSGTETIAVGQGDFSPEAVARQGDTLHVFAPIAPGAKQLAVEYHLPPARPALRFGFTASVPTVNLLVEEPEVRVTGFVRAVIDTQIVDQRTFRRWSGPVAPGDTIRLEFDRPRSGDRWLLLGLIGGVVVVLLGAAWRYRVLAAAMILVFSVSTPGWCATDKNILETKAFVWRVDPP